MVSFVKDPELVRAQGRKIELRQSLQETCSQLSHGEQICALEMRPLGVTVGIVINNEEDHGNIRRTLVCNAGLVLGVYAVSQSIVPSN